MATTNKRLINQIQNISADVSIVSGILTTDTQVYASSAVLTGVIIYTDGTNDATVTLHDGTGTGDKVICKFTVKGSDNYGGVVGVRWDVDAGIYLDISGTGAECNVYYVETRSL